MEKEKPEGRERALAEAVSRSAQQIWQAGLGAYAKAQQEGEELYARLVEEGGALQARLQECASGGAAGATDTVSKLAEGASRQAAGSLEKLEQIFEERVAQTLRKLGMPTQEDIQALATQIRELRETMAVTARSGAKTVRKSPAKPAAKAASGSASHAKPSSRKTKVNGRRAGSRA